MNPTLPNHSGGTPEPCRPLQPLVDLLIPESYRWVPPAVPTGPPFNIAQLFKQMADGICDGRPVSPGFDLAVTRHCLLDAIQKASDSGVHQVL
jgi:hypothetical protein